MELMQRYLIKMKRMMCGVVKVLKYLKRTQKGQGIVEYALLLAFIVGIAMSGY